MGWEKANDLDRTNELLRAIISVARVVRFIKRQERNIWTAQWLCVLDGVKYGEELGWNYDRLSHLVGEQKTYRLLPSVHSACCYHLGTAGVCLPNRVKGEL